MGTIETTFEDETGLTLVKSRGKLTVEDFHAWSEQYYPDKVTSRILWDETEADLSALDTAALRDLARQGRERSDPRRGGRAAIVYATPLEYGLGRMFQAFTEIEGLPFEVQSFQNFEEARAWLGVQGDAAPGVTVDHERRIIRKTARGELYTERSLKLVRELALAVNTHKDYSVLMDLRDTTTRPEMLDLMAIASECTKLKADFESKIAFLVPGDDERMRFAELFKACMQAQGFTFQPFTDEAAALTWLETAATAS